MQRGEGGFTLLEMLVVLAVFGLLMVAITQAMRFAGTSRMMAAREEGWIGSIEPADRALRAMIGQMSPGDAAQTDPPMLGTPERMDFRTELADPTAPLGLAQLRVTLRHEGGALVALTAPAPHAHWIGPPPPAQRSVLIERLARVEFAYWDGGQWLTRWDKSELPRLVRVRVVFPPGDPRHWPDVIAAPVRQLSN